MLYLSITRQGGIKIPDENVIVPIERFQIPVIDRIEKITGKRISIAELKAMDRTKLNRILGVMAKPPIKYRRGDPHPGLQILSREERMWARALVTSILEKDKKKAA